MKKYKLHQWLVLLLFTVLINACSKKITNAAVIVEEKLKDLSADSAYTPPAFILIPDDKAKTNKEDELYFDDNYGYRYWRYNDGKYYLDPKHNKNISVKKKTSVAVKLAKASS